jgi:hypothetical protein
LVIGDPGEGEAPAELGLFYCPKKIFHPDIGIAQRAFQRVPIHFLVKGKDDPPTIRMFHLHVTAAPVKCDKPQPTQGGEHLPARQQR